MKRKIWLLFLVILFINPFSFTFAKTKLIYERSEALAMQYIENSLQDDNWKNNNPKISWEWKNFYTDDEKNPSYIEFKISCDKIPNCWFILVNVDWDDVAVPISSTSGNTPSEVTHQQGVNNEKYHYFGPLDIYSENLDNWDVQTIDNSEQVDFRKNDKNNNERKQELKNDLNDRKIKSKEYKNSDDFKKKKEEIKDEILNMPKEEFGMKVLDLANADLPIWPSWNYISPWVSDIIINWSSTADCTSRTPCYDQFTTSYTPPPVPYTSAVCYSWCTPTAIAILFWYYDRQWLFPNLVPWTAPSAWIWSVVQTLVNAIKPYIWTTCVRRWSTNIYEWFTTASNAKNAKQYAISKWYINTTSAYVSWDLTTLFSQIKTEINAWRPIITHMQNSQTWHATVTYWYKSSPSNSNIVLMNMWWWKFPVDWGITYTYSSINQNLWAVYYVWINNNVVYSVTKFTIQ